MTLTMSDFLSRSVEVQTYPELEPITSNTAVEGHRDINSTDITILQNDINSNVPFGAMEQVYQDCGPRESSVSTPGPSTQGSNRLLFDLASGARDVFSSPSHWSVSPRDYIDESKETPQASSSAAESGHDSSFPESLIPVAEKSTGNARKAPPIPAVLDKEDIMEVPLLKSALKTKKESEPLLDSSSSSIIGELATITGEIKSLRENLAEMERSGLSSALACQGTSDEMKSECDDERITDEDILSTHELSFSDDGLEFPSPPASDSSSPPMSPPSSHVPGSFDDDVLFTVSGEGHSPYQTLEKSIISCASISGGDDFATREHTLLPDFSLQDFDDELDKINHGFQLPSATKSPKKALRFDLRATPVCSPDLFFIINLDVFLFLHRHRATTPRRL